MTDRLCEMLIQQGEISPEEAEVAEARQVQMGGALDSALLEHGVAPQRLRMAMGQAYESPLARPEDLVLGADPRALRAFPEQWAHRHQLVPLRLDEAGRVLTILSPAPADLTLLIRLGELLDVQLDPRIALELDVHRALARLYGVPLPSRFAALGPQDRILDVLPFRAAKERLAVADSRDEVARALLGFAGSQVAYAALLVVQGGRLRGWMRSGPAPEALSVDAPVEASPAASRALDLPSLHIEPLDDALAQMLGRGPGESMLLAPLRIRSRTVALLYADNGHEPIASSFAEDLGLLMTKAQQSLEALLLRRKAETLSQLGRAEGAALAQEPPAPISEDQAVEDDTDHAGLPIPEPVAGADDEPEIGREPKPRSDPMPQPEPAPAVAPMAQAESARATESLIDDFELPIEDPALTPDLPGPGTELPDEPIYGADDDDWEPVAVARANHAQGYEMVSPRVVEPRASSGSTPVATAPKSSRDLPRFEPSPSPPLELLEDEGFGEETPWPDASRDARADFGSSEDWSRGPSPQWSDAGGRPELGASDSQPVLLTDRLETTEEEPSIDLSEDDTADWIEQLESGVRAQAREAREVLLERGPSVLPTLMAHFPGRLEVDPFGRAELPSFEGCGPLLELLARFGREAHPEVARRMESDRASVRFFAAYFYSSAFVPEVIPRLIQRLHDEEARVCMVAARTLFGYRDHPDFSLVLEHLHGRMASASPAARRHAAYLVGLFRDVTAIPLLIEIIEHKDRAASDVAVDALAEITKQNFGASPKRWRSWFERNGDSSRIEWLIEGLSAREPALRRSASEELCAVTGENFGFDPEAPKRHREEVKSRWIDWWSRQPDYQSSLGSS